MESILLPSPLLKYVLIKLKVLKKNINLPLKTSLNLVVGHVNLFLC